MVIQKHKQDWEELGNLNPLWSILTTHREWDLNEFFLTGEKEIQAVMVRAKQLGYPRIYESALDFGCGVGRLTRVLANYFPKCYGVDIAESMIALAKELNQSSMGCIFCVNSEPHLQMFSDNSFDMVYTNIVLQHLPNTQIIKLYIDEFTRILKEGGLLVFQLPSYIPFFRRWQIRKRLYRLLRIIGINEQYIYKKLGLYPLHLSSIPSSEVVSFLNARSMRVLEVLTDNAVLPPVKSCTYYVTKESP